MDCLFCKIANHEIPASVIFEDENSIAFLDIHPLSPGHTIVIPKKHANRIIDLQEADAGPLFLTVKKVSDIIHASLKPDGFTIGINDGVGGGQGAPHLHMHVIPRWTGDKGGNLHGVVNFKTNETVADIAKKICTQN
jgi:histidine triad (HIT) family protein